LSTHEVFLLVLATVPFIAYPWFASFRSAELPVDSDLRESQNVRLYSEQCSLFDEQLAAAEIGHEQHRHLMTEAQQLLLQNTAPVKRVRVFDDGYWILPLLLLSVAVATPWLYAKIGAAKDEAIYRLLAEYAADGSLDGSSSADMVVRLEQRASERPENIYYWMLLGQFATTRADVAAAAEYYQRASELSPENGHLLAQYAQALFFADNNQFTERVSRALSRAFLVDPNNRLVLGLKGIEAFSLRQLNAAIGYWQNAQRGLDPSVVEFQSLQAGIDRARQGFPLEADGAASSVERGSANDGAPNKLLSDDGKSPLSDHGARWSGLEIALSIDPQIPYTPEQAVFVAVIDPKGRPMPIAARKLTASALPITIRLSDRDSLVASRLLSSFQHVEVIARLSSSGSATPQAGDWEVHSGLLKRPSKTAELALEISQKRP
jgi:cytochrome c-type biogenesis protein CcmH